MRLDRGNLNGVLVGLIIGILLVSVIPAIAGDGENLVVGEKNAARTVTRLNTRGGLRIDNFKSGNPALILNVEDTSSAPMEVNATGKIENLNADLLDGMEAAEFVSAADVVPFFVTVAKGETTTIITKGNLRLYLQCSIIEGFRFRWGYSGSGTWWAGLATSSSSYETIFSSTGFMVYPFSEASRFNAYDPATGDLLILDSSGDVGYWSGAFDEPCFARGVVFGIDG